SRQMTHGARFLQALARWSRSKSPYPHARVSSLLGRHSRSHHHDGRGVRRYTRIEISMQDYILETRGLSKAFRGFTAVDNVNLKVQRGSIHALIGPNGA